MQVNMLSSNGSVRSVAVKAFAEQCKTACQPGNLVPLADQGSVRLLGDNSQQMIVDEAVLHPYNHPPGTANVIRDCDTVLQGMQRWQGEDTAAIHQNVNAFCSKMTRVQIASAVGGVGLGAALWFAKLGWVGAVGGAAAAVAGIAYAHHQKGQAREFESQLTGWENAIKTGNPQRLPIPAGGGAVSFEYVFMVEKQAVGARRAIVNRTPAELLIPTTWSGKPVEAAPNRTIAQPGDVVKPKRWGKFDEPADTSNWSLREHMRETPVVIPESLAEPQRLATQLDPTEQPAGPAVQESAGKIMVGGIAVRKKRPAAAANGEQAT